MPLLAYFRNVGAVLLALLLIGDLYLPTSPAVEQVAVQRLVIRLYTERKWLDPLIFDTTQDVPTAAAPSPWDRNPPAPPPPRELAASNVDTSRVRDAFALYPRSALVEKKQQLTRK